MHSAPTSVLSSPAALPVPAGAVAPAPVPRPRQLLSSPETLHPGLWLGHQLGRSAERALPSGFASLDAQLPGGGWPRKVLTELLLPHTGVGEIRLLAASLAAVQQAGRLVMLFDPPAALSAWALTQWGLDAEQLLVIHTGVAVAGVVPTASARLWAVEQALKSGHVGAVLAWLPPRLPVDRMRRLQLAAHSHDGPAFVLREAAAQHHPSAAPLRLSLRACGADQLAVNVLKRRGPPLLQPLHLVLPAVLSEPAQRKAELLADIDKNASQKPLPAATFINLA